MPGRPLRGCLFVLFALVLLAFDAFCEVVDNHDITDCSYPAIRNDHTLSIAALLFEQLAVEIVQCEACHLLGVQIESEVLNFTEKNAVVRVDLSTDKICDLLWRSIAVHIYWFARRGVKCWLGRQTATARHTARTADTPSSLGGPVGPRRRNSVLTCQSRISGVQTDDCGRAVGDRQMPSTIIHLAFAGLLTAALLGREFDRWSLAVVLAVVAFPDLDSFIALVATPGHRTVFHNLWIPASGAVAVWLDTRIRDRSLLRDRWGRRGVRVAWVAVICYLFAHLGLDLVDGVINAFWPVYDQFYTLRGMLELSDQRGIVQTFVEWNGLVPVPQGIGTTGTVEITTGVDPGEASTERVFPVIGAGWELIILVTGTLVTAARLQTTDTTAE